MSDFVHDIDEVIALVRKQLPEVEVQQLDKIHPADDDGLWYFALPSSPSRTEIQIESSTYQCPFLIEHDFCGERLTRHTPRDTADAVAWLLRHRRPLGSP